MQKTTKLADQHCRVSQMMISTLVLITTGVAGCSHKDLRPMRSGIVDQCGPVVAKDPFSQDYCVPPKSVDPGHFGYVRPSWLVLAERLSPCHPIPIEFSEHQFPTPSLPILETIPETVGILEEGMILEPGMIRQDEPRAGTVVLAEEVSHPFFLPSQ